MTVRGARFRRSSSSPGTVPGPVTAGWGGAGLLLEPHVTVQWAVARLAGTEAEAFITGEEAADVLSARLVRAALDDSGP